MPPENGDTDFKSLRSLKLTKSDRVQVESTAGLSSVHIALVVLAITAVLAVCYVAKVPIITLLVSLLIAFTLEPIVHLLNRWRVPRWAGSFIAVTLLVACLYGIAYFSYNRAMEFIDDLPRYSKNIRQATIRFRTQAEKIQQSTESVLPDSGTNGRTIKVQQQSGISEWITSTVSGATEAILAISFVPFLVYFMLSWRDRTRRATVRLFAPRHRHKVNVALVGIAAMMRGFLVGNFVCGLFMSAVSIVAFGLLELPYFYFLGLISGFLSLIPYLGVVLAMLPPMAAGIGQLESREFVLIALLVVALHVFAVNVLFPKVIGKRLKLNPLAVTIALLMWGWLWGAMGLILAVPILGSLKIVCDHIDSLRRLGAWIED